jgi:hypothetical protein
MVYARCRDDETDEQWADSFAHQLSRTFHGQKVVPVRIFSTELEGGHCGELTW